MNRTIIIGDIHGCYAELMELLDVVAPSADDRIIALGDIVDRGPDSEKVLEFFGDTPNAVSLMGNHEHKHVRSARGEVPPALSQIIVKLQLEDAYLQWVEFMAGFPHHIELPEAILVHGFFEFGVPLEDQLETVMIGTLTGEKHICEKYPDFWYEHYSGPKPLIVGHHSYLGNGEPVIREGLFYGIDTGCVHGHRLTAMILPQFRIVSVPSRTDYWTDQKARSAILAASSKDELDLDWTRLQAYAQAPDRSVSTAEHTEKAKRCAEILATAQEMVGRVCTAVADLSQAILGDLAEADDWKSLTPQRRASRYALRVQEQPRKLAPLLHRSRQGQLDEKLVYRCAKTPRQLAGLLQALDLPIPWDLDTVDAQGTDAKDTERGRSGT